MHIKKGDSFRGRLFFFLKTSVFYISRFDEEESFRHSCSLHRILLSLLILVALYPDPLL